MSKQYEETSPVNETGVVFGNDGEVLCWHEPPDRSSGYLPDSQDLWEVFWRHRQKGDGDGKLLGFAHTHPWNGPAAPSGIDLTTFKAVEMGLGMRLLWPIVTFTDMRIVVRDPNNDNGWVYVRPARDIASKWIDELRRRSGSTSTPPA